MHCRTNGGSLYYHVARGDKQYKIPMLDLDRMVKEVKGADPSAAQAVIDEIVISLGARNGPTSSIQTSRFSGLPQVALLLHDGALESYEEKK